VYALVYFSYYDLSRAVRDCSLVEEEGDRGRRRGG